MTGVVGLTCVSPEFAGRLREAMGTEWTPGDAATDPVDRARLREEIDVNPPAHSPFPGVIVSP